MRIWVGACVVAAGCGGVDTAKKDAAVGMDSMGTVDSPMIDARMIDANNCMLDSFDGSTLDSHWAVVAGAAPTYTVAGSKITITDAPIATTPSNANESWINNEATDLGNQLGWAHAIGAGDFVLTAQMDYASSNAELMFAGISVTDGTHHLVAFAGLVDGQQGDVGLPRASIAGVGTMTGVKSASGALALRIERTGDAMTVTVDGTIVQTGTINTPLSYVSMVAVPYRLNSTTYPFGTAEFGFVQLCR
jgi:hypothetical protein